MKRYLIEFYSKRAPENLISLLKDRFDGIWFLYFQKKSPPPSSIRTQLNRVVEDLFGFGVDFVEIERADIASVLASLDRITRAGEHYVIDITGGNEIFIAASGMFAQEKTDRTVILRHHDIFTQEMTDHPANESGEDAPFPKYLKASHLLSLNGTPPLSAPRFHFSRGPLRGEITRLWNAVCHHLKDWNRFCAFSAEEGGKTNLLEKRIPGEKGLQKSYLTISESLKAAGIMVCEEIKVQNGRTTARFDLDVPKEALFLYEKAGNLLEMYTAMAAFDTGLFHDICVGVQVDWNGVFSAPARPDPRNEIDLILMKNNLPILASCKNTLPKNDHLYEISTMASHYGGYYATPMLLSSYGATPSVRTRAKEMKLVLIDNIRKMSYPKLVEKLKKAFS